MVEPVNDDLAAFDRRMGDYLTADSRLIRNVLRHIMSARGKRLRPTILFLVARSADYYCDAVIDAALAIELIHTATLLHDDVVDESDIRRGQETVNYQWNNLVSVLMGDFLFSRAFKIMVGTGSSELIGSISQATEMVSFGELRQCEELANYKLTEDEYIKIIAKKTASLFAVSCEAGPILARASDNVRRRFHAFGENIGIAFQIADDLLDYIGDKQKTGKTPGVDLIQGKVTLPLIYALNHSSNGTRQEMTSYLNNGMEEHGVERIVDFIQNQGGIEYAYTVARNYSDRAAEIFDFVPDTIYSQKLREILSFTVARDS